MIVLYSIKEVAQKLNKSPETIKYYIKVKKLAFDFFRGKRFITKIELERFRNQQDKENLTNGL